MIEPVTSLKVVVFPGPDEVVYTTEKRSVPRNSIVVLPSDRYSATQEEIWSIKQIIGRHDESRRNLKNRRQYACPPIVDFASMKQYVEIQPPHKPRRIFNGFFPSKIRTTHSNSPTLAKEKLDTSLEELVPDPNVSPYQNGAVLGRIGAKCSQQSEPAMLRPEKPQQNSENVLNNRRVLYSLRNGSPSPWINRYKLKQNSITSCNVVDLKTKHVAAFECPSHAHARRGFSR